MVVTWKAGLTTEGSSNQATRGIKVGRYRYGKLKTKNLNLNLKLMVLVFVFST